MGHGDAERPVVPVRETSSPFATMATPPTFVSSHPSPAVVVSVVLTHHHPEGQPDAKAAVLWHHLVHCTIDATLIRLGGCWKMWSGSPDLLLIAVGGAFGNKHHLMRPAACAHHALTIIAQLQQSLSRVASPCGRHLTAEYSIATGEVVAGVIGVRPPTFQVMGCVVEKARTLSGYKGLAEVKVTEAVAMLLDLRIGSHNLLGTAPFQDLVLKMYEVDHKTLATRQLPSNCPRTPFEVYRDDAVQSRELRTVQSLPDTSEEVNKMGGQHDSLLTWLPRSATNSLPQSSCGEDSTGNRLRALSEPAMRLSCQPTVQGPFVRTQQAWPGTDGTPEAMRPLSNLVQSHTAADGFNGQAQHQTHDSNLSVMHSSVGPGRGPRFRGRAGSGVKQERPEEAGQIQQRIQEPQALSPALHSTAEVPLTANLYSFAGSALLCFASRQAEAEFVQWANQFMARVDLIGAFLSVMLMLLAGLKESLPLQQLALLLVVPLLMLYVIVWHHNWFVRHRDWVIALEQLLVLWPILFVWHPHLLKSMTSRMMLTPLALFRYAGVELLVKHTINHARFRYQVLLHIVTFVAISKVCPPRVCAAFPAVAHPVLCQELITYGWQFSLGLLATLAGVYTWESMLRIYFITHRPQLLPATRHH